jgi:hypothetical protein
MVSDRFAVPVVTGLGIMGIDQGAAAKLFVQFDEDVVVTHLNASRGK